MNKLPEENKNWTKRCNECMHRGVCQYQGKMKMFEDSIIKYADERIREINWEINDILDETGINIRLEDIADCQFYLEDPDTKGYIS